jgi:hypothetical protein
LVEGLLGQGERARRRCRRLLQGAQGRCQPGTGDVGGT